MACILIAMPPAPTPADVHAGQTCRCGCSAERHEENSKALAGCTLCECRRFVAQPEAVL